MAWSRNPECRDWLYYRREPPLSRLRTAHCGRRTSSYASRNVRGARSRRVSVRSRQQQALRHRFPQPTGRPRTRLKRCILNTKNPTACTVGFFVVRLSRQPTNLRVLIHHSRGKLLVPGFDRPDQRFPLGPGIERLRSEGRCHRMRPAELFPQSLAIASRKRCRVMFGCPAVPLATMWFRMTASSRLLRDDQSGPGGCCPNGAGLRPATPPFARRARKASAFWISMIQAQREQGSLRSMPGISDSRSSTAGLSWRQRVRP